MNPPSLQEMLSSLVLLALILLVLRVFVFWYFGIGKIISLLESINTKLGPDKEEVKVKSLTRQMLDAQLERFRERLGKREKR